MSDNRSRFVLLCQQALVCAVVVAVAAPAAGTITLEFVAPPATSTASTQAPDRLGSRTPQESGPVQTRPAEAGPARGGRPVTRARVTEAPVETSVTEVPLQPRPAAGDAHPDAHAHDEHAHEGRATLSAGGTDDGHGHGVEEPTEEAVSPATDVDGYATVGVTWDEAEAVPDGAIHVEVRSRVDGRWGPWEEVPYEADGGPDPGSAEAEASRGGTNPLVVGDVDDVQVRVVGDGQPLPAGLRLAVVDPGEAEDTVSEEPAIDTATLSAATTTPVVTEPPRSSEPTEPTEPTGQDAELVASPSDVTPRPQIFSRAQWGADERLRDKKSLRYYEVHAGFVHHTVNANGYTRSQVPSIIRGIYAYHTRSRGWSDVGYNFLVDRFGRVWEGRAGGVDRPVVGAHTLGYNEYAFAMSAIGNFETARPSDVMLRAYGRLFAWKLSLHGVDVSSSRQWVGSRWLPAIGGHRDVGQTACPGRYLYSALTTIRRYADAAQRPFVSRTRDTDLAGSRWPDLVVRDRESGKAVVVRTGGQVGFGRPRLALASAAGADLVRGTPDLSGDGRPDLLVRDAGTKMLALHPGDGAGRFGSAARSFRQFRAVVSLAAVGDWNQDGSHDLVGLKQNGALILYRGTGRSGFKKALVLARDWATTTEVSGAGDFDHDGHADLLVRAGSVLTVVRSTGRAALGAVITLPRSWGGYDLVTGMGDVTNDGVPDVVARLRKNKRTFVFPGDGAGGLARRLGPFDLLRAGDSVTAVPGAAGGDMVDLVGRTRTGKVVVVPNSGGTNIEAVSGTGISFADVDLVLNVGDWNGDRHGDVMTRSASDGTLQLRLGDGQGGFAPPVAAGSGWGGVQLVAAVGDLTGDGHPDLLAQPGRGAMRVYPGNGSTGFLRSFVARSAVTATDHVGVGLWTSDGSPDSLFRRSDGTLVVQRGNGPGGLTGSFRQVGAKGAYDWLVGAGDVDGDGRPDLLVRTARNGILWLLPGTGSGFGPRRLVAEGFDRYDLVG